MTTDGPLEVAIVGAGRMGNAHLRALQSSDAVRVVAASDPDRAARDRWKPKACEHTRRSRS